jgi:hypothetical protein
VFRRQTVNIPLALAADRLHCVRLSLDSPNLPYPGDTRLLNFRSRSIALADHAAEAPALPDIAPADMGIAFGAGIYEVESTPAGPTRWLDNDAELWILPRADETAPARYLRLELQPGPSVGEEPFVLEVGGAVAGEGLRFAILGRQTISIPLALEAGAINPVTLRLDSPRRPVPDDPRILNALLFGAALADEPSATDAPAPAGESETMADVADPRDVRFGGGWFVPEQSGGQWLRWADNDAVLWVAWVAWVAGGGAGSELDLELDLEPGPSLGDQPLQLTIADAGGRALASERLEERRTIRLRLPKEGGPLYRLTFTTPTPRAAVENDPRILNFALHRLRMVRGDGSGMG